MHWEEAGMIWFQSSTSWKIYCRKMRAGKKGYLPLILCFYPRMIHLPCLCSVLWKKNSWNSETTLASPPAPQAASEAHHEDRCYKFSAENTYKEMSHPRPKETVLQRETFRTKPVEGISTNAKFGFKYQVVIPFPTIPPSCHISIVQRENKKLFCLEISQIKASEPYSRDKGRVEAFPHHGEEGEKEEEVVWGLASNPIQHSEFLNTSQRRDSLHKCSKPSLRGNHQGTGSTVIRSNPLLVLLLQAS